MYEIFRKGEYIKTEIDQWFLGMTLNISGHENSYWGMEMF